MGSAIWSARLEKLKDFPALFFLRFMDNHGMLQVRIAPSGGLWKGGSRTYVDALVTPFRDRILMKAPVTAVLRQRENVQVFAAGQAPTTYDEVILAVHADQALKMLIEPSRQEMEILSAFPYQVNEAVLHHDTSILPRNPKAWASWNYHISGATTEKVAVTYNMNILQGLSAPVTFCVTLNNEGKARRGQNFISHALRPSGIHTGFHSRTERHGEISGHNRTHFCGAYWFNGFHEDGLRSGLRVAQALTACREEVVV